ncbi:MAG TPA: TonB-dependent receptor plug domain-containing protein, partial [Opitutales bacterium]|nr:TonB-dependent receptor plug domain-containing protein [Opitutales bacterium]
MKTPPILSIHLSSGRGPRLLLQTCLLPAAILLPAALNADDEIAEAPVAEKSSVFELGEIVVKGVAESDIASLNTTMSAEDISIVSAKNVGRALSSLPGVTLTRFGPRNEEAVYVRGFDRTNVPIYVDGVPVCVPYDGFADLARFTTMDISSITLSKGYSSVLSGPNAFGGVINIVSAKPVNAFESSASLGVYSGGGLRSDVSAGTRQDKWFATLAASTDEMDNFTLPKDFVPTTYEDGDQRDNSYEKDWKVSGKVGYTPNATDEYVIGFSHQDGEKGTPPYAGSIATTAVKFWQWPQWNKSTVYYTSITHFGESYIHPRFYYDQYDNTLNAFDDATYTTMAKKSSFISIYEDYSYGGSLEGGTDELDKVTLKAAVHYKLDHHNEHNVGYAHYEFEDSIWSSGVEATTKFDSPWKAQLGVGYDTISTGKAVDSNTGLAVEGKEFDSINPAAVL